MKKNQHIQNEIDKTLQLLNSKNKIEADAFFYTRVRAKIDTPEKASFFDFIFDSPILKPALIASLFILNTMAFLLINYNSSQSLTADDAADLLNQEYFITQATDSFYYYNEE